MDEPAPTLTQQDIERLRQKHLGRSLSLAYREPLHIVRGDMQYLYDASGRAYLDGVNNVCHVGHCHPRVVEAGQKQMALLNTNTRYLHEHIVTYAHQLAATFPDGLDVCFFVCTGSEANELALRMARTYTGQRDVIVLDAAYHGHTSTLIDISPYKHDGPGGYPTPGYVHKVRIPDGYRGAYSYQDAEAGRKYAADVDRAVDRIESLGRRPAAFMVESIVSCGGQIEHSPGYLKAAYERVRRAGGVCIADEVQVGFGRAGTHFWAFESHDVVPDIVTLGKPIGNGHPLAAVVTSTEIADAFANGMEYFNTFGGNPVSCAIGKAVLDVIVEEGLQQQAHEVGRYLKGRLAALAERHTLIGDVRGRGMFLGVEFVRDRETLEPADREAAGIVEEMKRRGVLLSTDGPWHNVVKIKPPLPFNRANADRLASMMDQVLEAYP